MAFLHVIGSEVIAVLPFRVFSMYSEQTKFRLMQYYISRTEIRWSIIRQKKSPFNSDREIILCRKVIR
jgi:hypothetical protein